MKNIIVVSIGLFLAGCHAPLGQLGNENRNNLTKLAVGMSKQEVMGIMGEKTVEGKPTPLNISLVAAFISITNPYKIETLQGKEKTFAVLYYYTAAALKDYNIGHDELTPMVFDNDKLVGWGWGFLEQNLQKYEIRFRKGKI